eukprot:PhM_4_TR17279/c0_g2_i1/m.52663/K12483/EHD1; EH domain-containing protein 1
MSTGNSVIDSATGEGWDTYVNKTISTLQTLYNQHVKPLEDKYKYDLFKPSWYEESLSNAKPFVSFFGPWSAGKSTFINHLLQSNHLWTGPQPTTAQFTVVMYGDEPTPVGGQVLAAAKDLPFRGLTEFGDSFLECLQGYQVPHELLKSMLLVDTPGVLESSKDIHQRKYDYIKVCRWFVERSDLVMVMFDPTKMDAGLELRMLFKHAFKGNESKIRIILNKADSVETQELMRVYGALYWNLSNMVDTTEPPRVFVGSFWDQPYRDGTFSELFSEEKADLLHEVTELVPLQALDRKVTSLLRRAKDVFVHSVILGMMRESLPMMFGKDKAKKKALEDLPLTYERVGQRFKMNHRDFPPVDEYREFLSKFDLEDFPKLEKVEKEGLLAKILTLTDTILPQLLRPLKTAAHVDPRDRGRLKDIQLKYQQGLVDQMEGKQGIQGQELTVPAYRPSPSEMRKAASAQSPAQSPPPPPQQPVQSQQQVPVPDAQAMQIQMLQQQLMMMQQQQQQLMPQQQMQYGYQPQQFPQQAPTMDMQALQKMQQMQQQQMQQQPQSPTPPSPMPQAPATPPAAPPQATPQAEPETQPEPSSEAQPCPPTLEKQPDAEVPAAAAAPPTPPAASGAPAQPGPDMQAMMAQMMQNPQMMAQMMQMMQSMNQGGAPPPS